MHRYRVDNQAGHHGKRGKARQQPQREARAEHARAMPARQHDELRDHQRGEQDRERGVQAEQQGILACKQRGVRARRGEEEKPDGRDRAADQHQPSHRGGRTMKRFQGDSSCSSRPVSAESWKGLGSCVVSSRMRTAAS